MLKGNLARSNSQLSLKEKYVFKAKVMNDNDDDDDTDNQNLVKVQDNNIYFYADVSPDSILKLNMHISQLEQEMKIFGVIYNIDPPPIKLYINSNGGEVHSGLAAHDTIKNCSVPIHTIINGCACSAATIMSLAGHERFITENSYMLIHNISSTFWGKMHEFEDEMKNMNLLTKNLKKIYNDYGSINKKQLDALLKTDLLLEPNKCIKYGFIDSII